MSAIAGLLCAAADPEGPPALARVMERMRLRGPDSAGTFFEAGAALGHAALWTTPEARAEAQPFRLPGAGPAIAADALLVNREELLDALGLEGAVRRAAGDAGILLRAWAAWGEGMLDRVEGEFAFVLWDGPRRRLLCARDPSGARPLYWLRAGGRFACASSARALLAAGWIPARLHEPRIAAVLVEFLEGQPAEETFFEGILRLPAGSLLVATENGVSVRPAGRFDPGRGLRGPSPGKAEPGESAAAETADRFREAFRRAVGSRLRGDPSVGAMLSGGLDSSSIVCVGRDLLREAGRGALRTFSAISVDEARCAEAPFIRAVLDGGGLDPVLVRPPDLPRLLPLLEAAEGNFEEPFDAGTGIVPLLMFLSAREAGVRALLDGVDGDLAVSLDMETVGYAAGAGRWGLACSLARGFGRYYGISGARLFASRALFPAAPGALRRAWRRLRPTPPHRDVVPDSAIHPEFARAAGVADRVATVRATVYREFGRGDAAATADALHSVTESWMTTALERYGRAAAACGVEARHPFGDRALVETCLALPWEARVRGGRPKALLRDGLDGILPASVRDRGFARENLNCAFQIARLRLAGEGLRDRIEADLRELDGFVDGGRVRASLGGFLGGGGAVEADLLTSVTRLAGWLRGGRREIRETRSP